MSEKQEYRNKSVINQRGGAIDINNSTDREEIKISQYSGSNISLNNLTNSELATNNKQVKVINDSFESTGKTKSEFVGKDKIERVVENSYVYKGFADEDQFNRANDWREAYRELALDNSKFQINRGGESLPNGTTTSQSGSRGDNATKKGTYAPTVSPSKGGGFVLTYPRPAIVDSGTDEVTEYVPPVYQDDIQPVETAPENVDIEKGNVNYPEGPDKNSATEGGDWEASQEHEQLPNKITQLQDELNVIESEMGNGGDEITTIKRNKIEVIGSSFNDYPSIRIDTAGRSQPQEVVVGQDLTFVNVGAVPHVEEVDNSMNFPVGNHTITVGNKYSLLVGSGGAQIKSTGPVEIVGTYSKLIGERVDVTGNKAVSITSPEHIEIAAAGNSDTAGITLRSNKQVYVEPGLGVKNNLIVAGASYTAGETYLHHVTAPCEVQQTEHTTLYGKFNTEEPRRLLIGEANIGNAWFPVYALPSDDIIVNYPHSHHFNNLPLRLMTDHQKLRDQATGEGINRNNFSTQAVEVRNEKKIPQ